MMGCLHPDNEHMNIYDSKHTADYGAHRKLIMKCLKRESEGRGVRSDTHTDLEPTLLIGRFCPSQSGEAGVTEGNKDMCIINVIFDLL